LGREYFFPCVLFGHRVLLSTYIWTTCNSAE
jgi:hypothetical protein